MLFSPHTQKVDFPVELETSQLNRIKSELPRTRQTHYAAFRAVVLVAISPYLSKLEGEWNTYAFFRENNDDDGGTGKLLWIVELPQRHARTELFYCG